MREQRRSIVRVIHALDRYVLTEWLTIFGSVAAGLPILMVIMDLTGKLQGFLSHNLPMKDIALSYVFWMPECLFQGLPACVLFATVFAIANFTRHGEIAAAKASGVSFHRFIAPIVLGAALVTVLDLVIAEAMPVTARRRSDLLREGQSPGINERSNFAYAAEFGRVYEAQRLDVAAGQLENLLIERKGNGEDYPTVITSASSAQFVPGTKPGSGEWQLRDGVMHVVGSTSSVFSIEFSQMRDRQFVERPVDLVARPREPSEMRFLELTRFIGARERSGGDANLLRVERMLKIAVPVTCIVIALFGAPLATGTDRGGTGYGIGISLATTVTFLMLIQLTKAMGKGGVVSPDIVSWFPNVLFGFVALVLLARVRT